MTIDRQPPYPALPGIEGFRDKITLQERPPRTSQWFVPPRVRTLTATRATTEDRPAEAPVSGRSNCQHPMLEFDSQGGVALRLEIPHPDRPVVAAADDARLAVPHADRHRVHPAVVAGERAEHQLVRSARTPRPAACLRAHLPARPLHCGKRRHRGRGSPGAGTPPGGRPPHRNRPASGTAIRWPRRHRRSGSLLAIGGKTRRGGILTFTSRGQQNPGRSAAARR